MGIVMTNPGGDNEGYSKIDLENVDSWLPPEVGISLSKMIAARNRSQLEDANAASSRAICVDPLSPEREESPWPTAVTTH